MVLCIAKPSAGCACIFTALTVAVATGLVCIMALLQAGLAAHGHMWALDWAVANGSKSTTRVASSIDWALAAEREALHWEVRNSTVELRGLVLGRLDALRRELALQRAENHEMLESMTRLQRSMQRDAHQLRGDLLNISMEHGREITDLLLEQLKSLERINLRGTEREKEKKKSAIGEGLWGLLSSVREEREKEDRDIAATKEAIAATTTSIVPVITSTPHPLLQLLKGSATTSHEREKKKSTIGEKLLGLGPSHEKEKKKSTIGEKLLGWMSSDKEEDGNRDREEGISTTVAAVTSTFTATEEVSTAAPSAQATEETPEEAPSSEEAAEDAASASTFAPSQSNMSASVGAR